MTLAGAPSAPIPAVATRSPLAAVLVPLATIGVIVALAILPLLTPLAMHPLLDASQAHLWLGTTPPVAHELSDRTVADLVLGGSFEVTSPAGALIYTADEIAHLRDARTLLWLVLVTGVVSALAIAWRLWRGIDPSGTWQSIGRGGAVAAAGTLVIGVIGLVAFEPLFELFHRVFFPGGNWAFDATTSRLVQLYPFAFWELAASALGIAVVVLGTAAWLVGRHMAQRAAGARPVRPDGAGR
jgi:integral membrane protein (TIGR01906 family)